jgi:group II intron reverse transcriptase/maturase
MDVITKAQRALARKAQAQPQHRFGGGLYRLICRRYWVETALESVLKNKGSRTGGIDRVTREQFKDGAYREQVINELRRNLKTGAYRPQPVRRTYVPKANGRERPLGIATIQDRTVQMLLKMVLEPIFEADFLECSHGFRPQRRTMDAIVTCYRFVTPGKKFFWAVEGDIKAYFDTVHHDKLLRLVGRRVGDLRILKLIRLMLKAGLMEKSRFQPTERGVPQGSIVSPLLANIYLHELDRWWWKRYGKLSATQKAARRRKGQGNVVLIRYADDFVLLTNGSRQTARRLREEVRDFLAEELYLELSLSKTHVTHVRDGFDFLGYHLHYRTRPTGRHRGGKPVLLVTPSRKSVNRFRDKVRAMLHHKKRTDDPVAKMMALSRVTRGWGDYYRHVNAKRILNQLDHWIFKTMLSWLTAHHGRGVRWAWRQYVHPQGQRKNLAVRKRDGTLLFRHVMSDTSQRPYFTDWTRQNPYLTAQESPAALPKQDIPITGLEWEGVTSKRMALTYEARQRDQCSCQRCGSQTFLEVHHRKGYRPQDKPNLASLVTLCHQCHLDAHA